MHLEYMGPGPTELGRSGSYHEFEVQCDIEVDNPEQSTVTFMGRIDDDTWHRVAQCVVIGPVSHPRFRIYDLDGVRDADASGRELYAVLPEVYTVFIALDF